MIVNVLYCRLHCKTTKHPRKSSVVQHLPLGSISEMHFESNAERQNPVDLKTLKSSSIPSPAVSMLCGIAYAWIFPLSFQAKRPQFYQKSGDDKSFAVWLGIPVWDTFLIKSDCAWIRSNKSSWINFDHFYFKGWKKLNFENFIIFITKVFILCDSYIMSQNIILGKNPVTRSYKDSVRLMTPDLSFGFVGFK